MKCIFAFSLAIVVTQALQLDTEWERFKVKYAKRYSTESEHDIRKAIFADNLRLIAKHNAEEALGLHTFSLGVNNFADLTNDEFVQKFTSPNLERPNITAVDMEDIYLKDVVPSDDVDWRKRGAVTRVKFQGNCGSSWAFSATGSIEGAYFVKTGKLVSLSEQNLMDCGPIGGCTFDLPYDALLWTINNGGIDTEVSYPYTSSEERICRYSEGNIGAVITDVVPIQAGSEEDLQKAVSAVGPVSVGINASLRSFQLYHAGVYSDAMCSSDIIDLFVLVVGYGTSETGEEYWIVKNSWGPSWGMDGYILMAKDKNNICGIAMMGYYAVA